MFVKLVEDIEPQIWTKEMIQELSVEEVKMLMGFAETIEKVKRIARMHGSHQADAYALNLQMKL